MSPNSCARGALAVDAVAEPRPNLPPQPCRAAAVAAGRRTAEKEQVEPQPRAASSGLRCLPAARCPLPARLQPRHLGAAGERSGGGPRWDSGHGLPAWRRGLPGGARGSGKQPGAHPRAAAAGPLGAGVQPAGPPAPASSVGVRREAPLAWRRGAGRSHRQSPARPAPGWRPEGDSRDMGGKVPGASGHYRAISVLQTA